MTPRVCALAFLASAIAVAQLDTNTVTVTASRTLSVQADQIVFGLTVTSGIGTSLTDVLAALQPVGITAANFSGITSQFNAPYVPASPGPVQMVVQWSFVLPAPFANMKATVAALTNLQQSIIQNNSGLVLSFVVQGTQVSQQLQQMQVCPLSELLSDAQLQAQKLANVAGASLGSVLAMSSSTLNQVSANSPAVAVLGAFSFQTYTAPLVCYMTVKFSLLH